MMYDFHRQFEALGILPGDTVLMHSSMKAIRTELSPEAFLQILIDYLGAEGTLLLPALSYHILGEGAPYRFDSRETPACIGLLPETFRKMPGVVRSGHPTHSVCAVGAKAQYLTQNHCMDNTPVGPNSPFRLLPGVGGKILMLGNVLKCCTFMHGMEEIAGAPYCLNEHTDEYIVDGEKKQLYGHDFRGVEQRYDRIANILREPALRTGKIGAADCHLIDARALQRAATMMMAEDPYWFVDKKNEIFG